ncbi:DUF5677 domain-containing protein [Paenibacillus macquariensis]|uniref:DUF5677 domain-containing protein n=1 Tax=Paenibacillus macquariensis TaxID=948756 RepID=UPI001115AA9B|nr:DUF5677 domain-containing protein [Paenibacillus macquariensis]
MEELVNFGTHMFSWLMELEVDEADPTINLLFRNYLDVVDSISLLLKVGSGDTAIILLRSAFEIAMSILYILQEKTEERGLAYQLAHFKYIQKQNKKLDKGSDQYASFLDILKKDINARNIIEKIEIKDRKPVIDAIEQIIKQQINEEWLRIEQLKKSSGTKIEWFHLFDGPRNLKGLCEKLEHHALFDILYASWSLTSHGKASMNAHMPGGGIKRLRSPHDIKSIMTWTMNLTIEVYYKTLKNRIPNKTNNFGIWYHSVRSNYMDITDNNKKLLNRL